MDSTEDTVDSSAAVKKEVKKETDDMLPSELDHRTQLAIKLLFNSNMFEAQMTEMNLAIILAECCVDDHYLSSDIRKMPLGKLSKTQIAKGLSALVDIEEAVKNSSFETIANLTSRFYTLIPHAFGRMKPPVLQSLDVIRQKKDVMLTLSDIELTQSLQSADETEKKEKAENPIDKHYKSLKCDMKLVPHSSEEFKVISRYVAGTTQSGWKLADVWRLDRANEGHRFSVNDGLKERKLLWHGTNVAVVAAILNSGLRIMPHSGGLVGRGIYFASEHSKSSGYTCGHYGLFEGEKNIRFMFLVEVALGKSHEITASNSLLRAAPEGFNSIVARGRNEPDPKKNVTLELDGKKVVVPVGKPVPQTKFKDSGFIQSEYLIYNEHQARLRFLLKFTD
ncbi:hypothetical protein HAZT_HAZT011681 [Hyalella azteca]|uniref:Poly [ADP-ribose] polymerase n=1 Tax=Hyalella azteca TaxID=294128 RepID=A0A6A0GSW7_HYAAZ|nr:hypothetical protein HAZT_HAZT011681 [Hyalella azteca]